MDMNTENRYSNTMDPDKALCSSSGPDVPMVIGGRIGHFLGICSSTTMTLKYQHGLTW